MCIRDRVCTTDVLVSLIGVFDARETRGEKKGKTRVASKTPISAHIKPVAKATMVIATPAYKAKKLELKLLSGFVIVAYFPPTILGLTLKTNTRKVKSGQ